MFVLTLLPKNSEQKQNQAKNSSFPDSWAHNDAGKTGLALAGIAFVAGALLAPAALHLERSSACTGLHELQCLCSQPS